MSVIVHEVAHGYAALYMGDQTARRLGRLTLNPLKHLDPFGSVILPLLLILSGTGIVFGWAKPVPYNPNNLTNRRKGTLVVASAGIIANICLALFFSLAIRLAPVLGIANGHFIAICGIIVLVNIVLAVFNIIPIPPLDGSRMLFALLPARYHYIETFFDQYGFVVLIFIVFFVWQYVAPILMHLFSLLTGLPF